jgi:hypothetical protein
MKFNHHQPHHKEHEMSLISKDEWQAVVFRDGGVKDEIGQILPTRIGSSNTREEACALALAEFSARPDLIGFTVEQRR